MRYTLFLLLLSISVSSYGQLRSNIISILKPAEKGRLLLALKPNASIPDVKKETANMEEYSMEVSKLVYTVDVDAAGSSFGDLAFYFIDNELQRCTFETYLDSEKDSKKFQLMLRNTLTETYGEPLRKGLDYVWERKTRKKDKSLRIILKSLDSAVDNGFILTYTIS